MKKLGVDYPVALDDDMTIWNDFENQYWPADYLYDRNGRQASVHFGEGGYEKTEDEIRRLLAIPAAAPHAVVKGDEGGSVGSPIRRRRPTTAPSAASRTSSRRKR